MKVKPGDILGTKRKWLLSKYNRTAYMLGANMGNDLLVVAVLEDKGVACVLSPNVGPTWVNLDNRSIYVVR